MLKKTVDNPRYPHLVRVIRRLDSVDSINPMKRQAGTVNEYIVYAGEGRSFTDTTTDGDINVDTNKRKASIPKRFDTWDASIEDRTVGWPLDGDIIEVQMGNVTEQGRVKDFEPDNDRSIIYWELTRN